MHIFVYQVLSYAQIVVIHACVLKCIFMLVQWKFYGACLCMKKKNSMQMHIQYEREREHMHVCGRLSPTEVHPTLSGPSAESPKSQMATAHRQAHTDTHKHTYTHRAGRRAQLGPKSTDELV